MSKKKVPGIYRTTISISADLKRRMDRAGSGVNWSALAAQAFESKLADIAAKKEKKSMEDVIQRLRVSRAKTDEQSDEEGREAGQGWAKDFAEAIELERLEKTKLACGYDWGKLFDPRMSDCNPQVDFVHWIRPEAKDDSNAVESFWEEALGDDDRDKADDPGFVFAFIEGALEVWGEVKGKL